MKTIYQRAYRKQSDIHHCPGHISPPLPIEDTVVQCIIKMAEIRQSLTPSRGLALINSLISETTIQKDLEEWGKNSKQSKWVSREMLLKIFSEEKCTQNCK